MLCLKQCIDMCDLTPEQASALADRASLAEIVAAQAQCPRLPPAAANKPREEETGCTLLDRLHTASD